MTTKQKQEKNARSDLDFLRDYQENTDLDYYLGDGHWNKEVNLLLYKNLSVFYDGISLGKYIDVDGSMGVNDTDYRELYGMMFNKAYYLCNVILDTIAPETKVGYFLKMASSPLMKAEKKEPGAIDKILGYHIMGMVFLIFALTQTWSERIDDFLIFLSIYHDDEFVFRVYTHGFATNLLPYETFSMAILNSREGLPEDYNYKQQHEHLYSKQPWYKSDYEELRRRMKYYGLKPNNFYDSSDSDTAVSKNIDSDFRLPDELNLIDAQKWFKKAIKKGYFKSECGTIKWVGIGKHKSQSCLAYFLGKVYGYVYSPNGNIGNSIPEEALSQYFHVKNIRKLIKQSCEAGKVQTWRSKIDDFFA